MPVYEVEDTRTGKIVNFDWNGTNPPTDQDMEQVFGEARKMQAGPPPTEQTSVIKPNAPTGAPPWAELGMPAVEAGLSIASSIPAYLTGRLAKKIYAAGHGLMGDPKWKEKSEQAEADVHKFIPTYQPSTEAGRQAAEMGGKILSLPFEAVKYPFNKVGEKLEEAGYPGLGYITKEAGEDIALFGMPGLAKGGMKGIKSLRGKVLPEKTPVQQFNEVVDYGMNKGIRPPVKPRGTASLTEKDVQSGRDMVKSIIDHKNDIQLTDAIGNQLPKGSLPKDPEFAAVQMAQAAEQAKKIIRQKSDAMRIEASGKGFEAPLDSVVEMLDRKLGENYIQDMPEVYDYIKKERDIFANRKKYSLKDAENRLQAINAKSGNYYNKPNPNLMNIDVEIAGELKKILDDSITKAEGPGFAEFKKQYGNILANEKRINDRATMAARRNPYGFFDIGNISIAAEVLKGGATMAATGGAKGGGRILGAIGMGVVKNKMKKANDPNIIVSKMFDKADKILTPKERNVPMVPPMGEMPTYPAYSDWTPPGPSRPWPPPKPGSLLESEGRFTPGVSTPPMENIIGQEVVGTKEPANFFRGTIPITDYARPNLGDRTKTYWVSEEAGNKAAQEARTRMTLREALAGQQERPAPKEVMPRARPGHLREQGRIELIKNINKK